MAKGKSIDDILNEFEEGEPAAEPRADKKGKPAPKPSKKEKGIPTPQPTDARLAPVTAIRTKVHKTNARGKLTEDKLEDLLPSVAKVGIIQPLTLKDEGDGSFTLIDGKRRLATAKKVGLKDVPYVLINEEVTNIEMASVVENICRRDLEAMEEAHAYKVLIDGYKMSQNDLAKFIGKSSAHVSQKLALLGASKKDQEKLAKGQATEASVRRALTKPDKKGKAKPGPKVKSVNIPIDDLPDGVTMSVKDEMATVTLRVPVGTKNVAKATKAEITKLVKKMSDKRINAAYKAITEV